MPTVTLTRYSTVALVSGNADTVRVITLKRGGDAVRVITLSGGIAGAPGQGVPTGGTTGQALVKSTDANYATEWADIVTAAELQAAVDSLQAQIDALAYIVEHGVPITNVQLLQVDSVGTFTAFEDYDCTKLIVVNGSNSTIDIQRDGAGAFVQLWAGNSFEFGGLTNADQIAIRPSDLTTAVTIGAEAFTQ